MAIFLLPAFYMQHFFNAFHYKNSLLLKDKEQYHWSSSIKNKELPPPPKPDYNQCKLLNDTEKFDCYPEDGANVQACEARGCCWIPHKMKKKLDVKLDVPYCFYPPNYNSYTYINVTETAYGLTAFLRRKYRSPYPNDVETIKMDVRFETSNRLHVKVIKIRIVPKKFLHCFFFFSLLILYEHVLNLHIQKYQ